MDNYIFRRKRILNISEEEIRELARNDLLLYLERIFNAINKSNEFHSLPVPDFTLRLEENMYLCEKDLNARVFFIILIMKY